MSKWTSFEQNVAFNAVCIAENIFEFKDNELAEIRDAAQGSMSLNSYITVLAKELALAETGFEYDSESIMYDDVLYCISFNVLNRVQETGQLPFAAAVVVEAIRQARV